MSTPGIIGRSGKWPGKKLSFIVTFLIATAVTPGSCSITLSTRRKGNLCPQSEEEAKERSPVSPARNNRERWINIFKIWTHRCGKISRILLMSMTVGKAGIPSGCESGDCIAISYKNETKIRRYERIKLKLTLLDGDLLFHLQGSVCRTANSWTHSPAQRGNSRGGVREEQAKRRDYRSVRGRRKRKEMRDIRPASR